MFIQNKNKEKWNKNGIEKIEWHTIEYCAILLELMLLVFVDSSNMWIEQ